jgi:hypothetical protein
VNESALLDHECAGAGVDGFHVVIGELRHLAQTLGLGFERPDVRNAIAIRNEKDGVTEPHGIRVF